MFTKRRSTPTTGSVIDGSSRFGRHRRARRRRIWGALGLVAALIAFVLTGVFSPIMSVRDIRVEGVHHLPAETVKAALADLGEKPLALVTNDDIGTRLAGMIQVQSYDFRLEPPSTLVVEITERERLGVIPSAGGFAVVDGAGVTLEQVPAQPPELPRFELPDNTVTSPGFTAAAAVAAALPDDVKAQVDAIRASSLDAVELSLRDGDTVVWGSAEQSTRKAEVLAALRALAGSDILSYDVSSPDAPVTRTTPAEPPAAPQPAPSSNPAPPAPPAQP